MKRIYIAMLLTVLFVLCGCNQEKRQENNLLPASHEPFIYTEIEEVDCMTVDESGLLYTCVWKPQESTGPVLATEYVYRPDGQQISIYDLDGNCIDSQTLEFGNGTCENMLFHGDILYCVVSHMGYNCPVLFAVDTTQWTVTEAMQLKGYSMVSYLEPVGDYFYILGRYREAFDTEYSDAQAMSYRYNRISRINMTEQQPRLELMNVELPVAMYAMGRETLVMYRYVDGIGYGFIEFDQQAGTLTEAGWKNNGVSLINFGGCDEGFLYIRQQLYSTGLYYGTPDGKEAQVYPEKVWLNRPIAYQKGFAFFFNLEDNQMYRICVAYTIQDNPPLQFLQMETAQDFPYDCGFQMEKNMITEEELALKVLAQDRDFDLFLLSSGSYVADSIRKNGVFYTLNDVEGVEEYLNACFPYLNELARNEEGDIWMVPVMLAVPGIIYNKEYCAAQGVDFTSMDLEKFLIFTEEAKEENPDYIDISEYVYKESLIRQYLSKYNTFDTDLFRKYAKIAKAVCKYDWIFHGKIADSVCYDADIMPGMEEEYPLQTRGELPEFYYFYNVYSQALKSLQNNAGDMEEIGMLGVPKMEENMKNGGTLTFMAVNPQSENLEATLEYISAFSKYMLTKQDSFLLSDKSTYTDTPFTRDWYELYANGTVYFGMEGEVFLDTFHDYLEGTIDLETAIAEMERRRKLYLEE